jgi:iron(III) transport system substrate-binding protein
MRHSKTFAMLTGLSALSLALAACSTSNTPTPQASSENPASPSSATTPTDAGPVDASPANPGCQSFEDLVAAADAEGAVSYGSTMPPETLQILNDAFNERFGTNITITQIPLRATEGLARAREESQAGNVTVDALHVSTELLLPLIGAPDSPFEAYDWMCTFGDELPDLAARVDAVSQTAQGAGLEYQHLTRAIIYNTDLVAPEDVPQSWNDLLDPKWSGGKLVIDPQASSSYQLIANWTHDEVVNYSLALLDQNPIFASGQDNQITTVASGEALVGVTVLASVKDALDRGEPIGIARSEFFPGIQQADMTVKGSPHINAARLWIAWMDTEGTRLAALNGQTSLLAWDTEDNFLTQTGADMGIPTIIMQDAAKIQEALNVRNEIIDQYTQRGVVG